MRFHLSRAALCLTSALALAAPVLATPAVDMRTVAPANPTSALPANWNRTAAFMEIFVRSYQDSDGDGIGDFNGLTSRLDYLKDLGITGIWLMPINPSTDGDHGYAVNDYRAVNPDYGTLADFDRLVAEAHKRGIGVVLDLVPNHAGSDNPIFQDAVASKTSAYRDWFLFQDRDTNAQWPYPWWRKSGTGYYYGISDDIMPDWNLRNPKVVAYLSDSMRFWLNRGVDGFRVDAVTQLIENGPDAFRDQPENLAVVQKLSDVLDAYDNRYLVCEANFAPRYYTQSCRNSFAFKSMDDIRNSALKGTAEPGLIEQLSYADHDRMPLVLQSHDWYVGDRLTNQLGVNDEADYRVMAAISILASRTPFTYYGEEIGMSNGGTFTDPGIRSPMSWTAVKQTAGFTTAKPYRNLAINVATHNVAAEAGDPSSLLEYYRALYHVRLAHPVISDGNFKLLSKAGNPVLAFTRSNDHDAATIVINLSDKAQDYSLDAGTGLIDALANGPRLSGQAAVHLPPKTTAVLVKSQ